MTWGTVLKSGSIRKVKNHCFRGTAEDPEPRPGFGVWTIINPLKSKLT